MFVPFHFIPEYRPARKLSILSSKGWWLNRWPFLGWLETFLKVSAWLFVPYVIRDDAVRTDVSQMPFNFALETAIMFLASALLTVAIVDRMVYREVISMIFVFPNNWAHWTVTLAMHRYGKSGINLRYFRIFCWLTFAADVVKLIFFAYHDFSRLNVSRYFLYALVALFAAMYFFILILDYGYLRISPHHSNQVASFCDNSVIPTLVRIQSFTHDLTSQ